MAGVMAYNNISHTLWALATMHAAVTGEAARGVGVAKSSAEAPVLQLLRYASIHVANL